MAHSRRTFLLQASRAFAAGVVAAHSARAVTAFANNATASASDSFVKLDGVALADLLARREVTPEQLLEATIDRIDRINPQVNAVVARCYDEARSRAAANDFSGRFAGLPLLVKDLDDVAGVRTSAGCRGLMNNVPDKNGAYIQACVDTGFNIVGKTNTPEFGLMGTTESLALGPCYNPWDGTRSSGGSSGGAGAAVAAGLVPIATGSDGGGSIRIPACCCGIFGLKVSRGRLKGSTDGFELSVKGVLTRSVRDTAHVLAETERHESSQKLKPVGLVEGPSKKRLRIGMHLTGLAGGQPDADVRQAVEATAALCEELGHKIEPINFDYDGQQLIDDFLVLWSYGAAQSVKSVEATLGRAATLQDLEPLTLGFAKRHQLDGMEKVMPTSLRLMKVADEVRDRTGKYDVVLSPVLSSAPPRIGEQSPAMPFDEVLERMSRYVAYTPLYNVTGQPAISVPLAWNDAGLPIGSQFSAAVGDEAVLLGLAYELEQARPWAEKWAPLSAVATA